MYTYMYTVDRAMYVVPVPTEEMTNCARSVNAMPDSVSESHSVGESMPSLGR